MSCRSLRFVGWLALLAATVAGCRDAARSKVEVGETTAPVIFGQDNRVDPTAYSDRAWAEQAMGFTVALVSKGNVIHQDGRAELAAGTFGTRHVNGYDSPMCEGATFYSEPTAAFCSGALIAPDLVLTAGHCIADSECASTSFVFDYRASQDGGNSVAESSVFGCKAVLSRMYTRDDDYAFVQLDRPAEGRALAPLAKGGLPLHANDPLIISGFPSGLPHKIEDSGEVVDPRATDGTYFTSRGDIFPGNSGSGVYLDRPQLGRPLVGVLVRSLNVTDFVFDQNRDCWYYERCDEHTNNCGVLENTYAPRALAGLCAKPENRAGYPSLCSCGDGVCDASENAGLCNTDCPSSCGDEQCGKDESAATCADDCDACGDGVCGATESSDTCCADCACAPGQACGSAGQCVLAPQPGGVGDTCANPVDITVTSQVLRGVSKGAGTDSPGSCSWYAPDVVYRFELAERTHLRITPRNGDVAIFQSQCSRDAEVSCTSWQTLERDFDAGVYFLVVSNEYSGDYEVAFELGLKPGGSCETPIPITFDEQGKAHVRGDTTGRASSLSAYTPTDEGTRGGDLVYRFELASAARVSAELTGVPYQALWFSNAYCSSNSYDLTEIDGSGSGRVKLLRMLEAGPHTLVVDGIKRGDNGPFALDLSIESPTGESCAFPEEVDAHGSQTFNADLSDSTADDYGWDRCEGVDHDQDEYFGAGKDRAYRFTISEPTTVSIGLEAQFDGLLRVTQNGCDSAQYEDRLACEHARRSRVERLFQPGTYYVMVDGRSRKDAGPYTLHFEFTPGGQPTGEHCADAIPIPGEGEYDLAIDTHSASKDVAVGICNYGGDKVYSFELAEPTRVQVTRTNEWGFIRLFDGDCSDYTGCERTTFADTLPAGRHFLVAEGVTDTVHLKFGAAPGGVGCADAIPIVIENGVAEIEGQTGRFDYGKVPCFSGYEYYGSSYQFELPHAAEVRIESISGESFGLVPYVTEGCWIQESECSVRSSTQILAAGTHRLEFRSGQYVFPYHVRVTVTPGDYDTDGDGVSDDADGCSSDPYKTSAGQCGCGRNDYDGDKDGTPYCLDQCDSDPHKVAPGACGCGNVDPPDTDGDGAVCYDYCPNDPKKKSYGTCGCGVPDVDSDGDGTLDCKEQCPSDALKVRPGACGCGNSDVDRDLDRVSDCVDGCPDDRAKAAPGQCGCGKVETDSDGDGSADCVDGCPSDANKNAPGRCGCGQADTDSDGDATPDCVDACAADAAKVSAGQCGCGVPDVDGDADGALDCHDGCASDGHKTAPGACGCGVSDADSDGDGTPDCHDACAADASKVAKGVCGCGVSDADSDGDGTPDCHDACAADASKVAKGACGCSISDADSDGDGTPDCHDECAADAAKTTAGACGCGVSDADSDGDGTPDCHDECAADAGKIAKGICGCGVSDADSDGDGTLDCHDACAHDATKTAAGVCGCGVSDADSDGDGTPDCHDECAADASKVAKGTCGCGVSDADSDADGTPDCHDACPADASKVAKGVCGCGLSDADHDGNGKPDCVDECPDDPGKSEKGTCGCGVSDADQDGDGKPDCVDECAADPKKSEKGACGCGVSDADSDGDGTPDCHDACAADPNKTAPGKCSCGQPETPDCDGDDPSDEHMTPSTPEDPPSQPVHHRSSGGCSVSAGGHVTFASWFGIVVGLALLRRRRSSRRARA